jgi:hypothetical protein
MSSSAAVPPALPVLAANASKTVAATYAKDLAAYNTFWKNYYAAPIQLPLPAGWNVVTGDFDGSGAMRSLRVSGDVTGPDLKLSGADSA